MRFGHISIRCYSNEVRITSFERPFQAQRNDPRCVFVARTKRKLQAFEILDIYAWVHYMTSVKDVITVGTTSSLLVYDAWPEIDMSRIARVTCKT